MGLAGRCVWLRGGSASLLRRRLPARRATAPAEPVIPLQLFANRVFTAASAIGFVVGFAMFGAMTFLPLFFQEVKGVSADPRRACGCSR